MKQLDEFSASRKTKAPDHWMQKIYEQKHKIDPIKLQRLKQDAIVEAVSGENNDEKMRITSDIEMLSKITKFENKQMLQDHKTLIAMQNAN